MVVVKSKRCVLNWFGDWSNTAYYQVGKEFTSKIDLEKPNVNYYLFNSNRKIQIADRFLLL